MTSDEKEDPNIKYERLKFFKNENGEKIGVMVRDDADQNEIRERIKKTKTPFSFNEGDVKENIKEACDKYQNHVQKILSTVDLEKGHLEELDDDKDDEIIQCQSCEKKFKIMFEMRCKKDKHILCGKCLNTNIEESNKGCQFDSSMIHSIKELNDLKKNK